MNKYEKKVKKFVERANAGKRVGFSEAVRNKCLDCVCYQTREVTRCSSTGCPLWYFRSGRNNSGNTSKKSPSHSPARCKKQNIKKGR
jgi:hypothetical protein